ncbi:MAG: DUF4339 domain-containing protein [Treponema sp.]|nr:DUF4339 domain-containing protein [Treponema sp.]
MRKILLAFVAGIILVIITGGFVFAQAAPVLTGYFVAVGGQTTGPHNTLGLMELVNRGLLNRDTFVWRDGMPDWVTAGTVGELAPLFHGLPPSLPAAAHVHGAVVPGMPPPLLPDGRVRRWHNSFAPGVEGNRVFINTGVGLGPTGTHAAMGIPPISASVSFRVSDTVPITVGATGIFTTWRWEHHWGSIITYRNIGLGARVMYHFNFARNFDSYIGLNFGYVFQSVHVDDWWGGTPPVGNSFFLWGAFIGARFFFSDVFGIYAETGASSLQFLSIGLTFKI